MRALIRGSVRRWCALVLMLFSLPGLSQSQPPLKWLPNKISVLIQPSESLNAPVVLRAISAVPAGELTVVPALQPYVSVHPTLLPALTAGQTLEITVRVAAPATALPLSIEGVLRLRALGAEGRNATIATPLPIQLSIVWPTASLLGGKINYQFPTFGQIGELVTEPNQDGSFSSTFLLGSNTEPDRPGQYAVTLIPNPTGQTLLDWFTRSVDISGSIIASGRFRVENLPNQVQFIELTGPLPNAHLEASGPVPEIFGSVPGNTHWIIIQTLQGNSLRSIGVDKESLGATYRAILSSIVVNP